MKVFVIGSGGREHALVWKIKQSPRVSQIFCTAGNGGICAEPGVECVAWDGKDIDALLGIASRIQPDLTVIGPELPLAQGVVDELTKRGLRVFGPTKAAAQLEASRASCIRQEEVRAALNLSNQLAECNAMAFTTADAAAIRESNNRFPFNFTKSPRSITATLSLPLFDGFAREQRLQEAQANRSDARYSVRAKELALTADVTAAYLTLVTAEKTAALQEQNAAKAKQELKLVQDRYRIGATTFVDLTEARATYERAESDRITAVYDYHKAFAALESAVGHPLR